MDIHLIYAQSLDSFIGRDGKIPWHIPEDLDRFKWFTTGCPVIMGRKTWDSLPEKVRPLPGRRNIVMTRSVTGLEKRDGAQWVPGVRSALACAEVHCKADHTDNVWVIGGEAIYNAFLPFAKFAFVTIVHEFVRDGDAKSPMLELGEWERLWFKDENSKNGIEYTNVIFRQKRPFLLTY